MGVESRKIHSPRRPAGHASPLYYVFPGRSFHAGGSLGQKGSEGRRHMNLLEMLQKFSHGSPADIIASTNTAVG